MTVPTLAPPRPRLRHATSEHELPVWPLWLLFGGFPVLFILGLGGFATQIAAIPMATCLALTHRIRVPRGYGLWFLFLVWMLFTGVEVHGGSRVVGFGYRATLYIAGAVAFLYVYNSSARRLPISRLAAMTTTFLAFVVVGGYLGIVAPHHSFTTPMEHLLPGSFIHNDLVSKMVHPPFAQISHSSYFHVPPRPAAPFEYTNDWGVNFAFLVPFVIAWLSETKRKRVRVGLVILLIVGTVPALATLNRGMILGLSVGVFYAAVRFAFRGHGRALLAVVVVAGAALTLMSLLHFGDRVNSRLDNSSSNTGRVTTYDATYHEVLRSPVLGFGAPSSSTVSVNGPDLGTQGQFWTVLYSSGFVGAALFVLAFLNLVWKTRKARTSSQMWLHVVGVIALAVLLVYRIQATELVLFMVAMAVVLRDSPAPLRVGGRPVAAVRRGQRR